MLRFFCVLTGDINILTPWEPVYKHSISYLEIDLNQSFRLPYQCHSSSADCARELFKPSRFGKSSSQHSKKCFLVGGCGFFCEWRHKWSSF